MCGKSGVQIPNRPNLTQHCKRFTIASTFAEVVVLPWCYDAEMGTANLLTLWHNMTSIMKGKVKEAMDRYIWQKPSQSIK